jgi:mannose-6-phosphate isomerase-like protein (cupin superfamily)
MGGVGTAVLFENDRVKIWEMDLAPGEETGMHHHTMDYMLIIIEGDRILAIPPEDAEPPFEKEIEAEVKPGQVFYVERGGKELARNVGKGRYYEILVELKD